MKPDESRCGAGCEGNPGPRPLRLPGMRAAEYAQKVTHITDPAALPLYA